MYCNTDDILTTMSREDLITLTNPDVTTARDIDVVYLNKIINDSSKIIDGYVGSRYNLPFTTVPSIIITICKELTFYSLHTFGNYSDADKAAVIQKRYDKAISMLKEIASGTIVLENVTEKESSEALYRFSSKTQIYTSDYLSKF
ncbi:MAG TPA: DUF1320 domain-containing protein [Candidatus Kapabacteria bacterium]|nr:DUF1320 domain-containing protein [Candidatus Kapabacteria bacterium]